MKNSQAATHEDPPKANDIDKRPLDERKENDPKTPTDPNRTWHDNPNAKQAPRAAAREQGDANTIGSPDLFLTDRHRDLGQHGVKIRQVWADGEGRGYAIASGSQLGYFELTEGMSRAAAEAALSGAYDGTAVVL